MTKTSSNLRTLLSAVAGGLIVLAVGAVLMATDVIPTGETTREVTIRQEPITTPASGDEDGVTVQQIYDRAGPGVVFVQARGVTNESPFGLPDRGSTATGSGFVLDKQGYIATNAHIVEGSRDVRVRFGEGELVDARVVGQDLSSDLAVLRVNLPEDRLKPISLGDSSKAEVGDPAVAIGNPLGFDRTVTTGIVSAIQREITAPNGFSIDNVIQTDAAINPGNSGGPLLDGAGRVLGINSQIATTGGGNVGIGFAVPVNLVKKLVPELKRSGKIDRAFLGITTAPVADLREDLNLPSDEGALVQDVVPDGPADKAGLRAGRTETADGITLGGDLIVKVDGTEIKEPADVADAIADNKPGQTVVVEFFRGEDRKEVEIKLGKRPQQVRERGGEPGGPEEIPPFP
jgi:S1-C subfamily serine protease